MITIRPQQGSNLCSQNTTQYILSESDVLCVLFLLVQNSSMWVRTNLQPLHYAAIGGIDEKAFDSIHNSGISNTVNVHSIRFTSRIAASRLLGGEKTLQYL